MVFLAIFGYLNGYVTARYLKFFGVTDLYFTVTVSAVALPLYIVGALALEMFFAWIGNQPTRHTFKVVMLRTFGWYLLNAVLCYLGSFHGYV